MPAAESGQANTGLASPVVFGAGLLMLGLSPIIRGGNRHVALVLLEWLALLLLVALLARGLAFRDRADAQPIAHLGPRCLRPQCDPLGIAVTGERARLHHGGAHGGR